MEIIKCPNCGGEVLSTSDTCFRCGYKLPKNVEQPKPTQSSYYAYDKPNNPKEISQSSIQTHSKSSFTQSSVKSSTKVNTNVGGIKCANCGCPIYEGTICPKCGCQNESMKWYKWLKVLLWLSIIDSIYYACESFTMYYGFMNIIVIILGVGWAIYDFITWNALRNFKKSAPKLVPIGFLVNAILDVILYIFAFAYFGKQIYSTLDFISTAVSFLMAWANHVYFTKRAHFFDK